LFTVLAVATNVLNKDSSCRRRADSVKHIHCCYVLLNPPQHGGCRIRLRRTYSGHRTSLPVLVFRRHWRQYLAMRDVCAAMPVIYPPVRVRTFLASHLSCTPALTCHLQSLVCSRFLPVLPLTSGNRCYVNPFLELQPESEVVVAGPCSLFELRRSYSVEAAHQKGCAI
jgi:hypothetical protein